MEKTLQAIRDRLFLLIKESELRENTIASSLSKNKSRLTVFCPKDPTKVGKLLNLCTQQVLGSSPKQHIQLQRNGSFLTLTIENTGDATLEVTGITSDNPVFSVEITSFTVEPEGVVNLQ